MRPLILVIFALLFSVKGYSQFEKEHSVALGFGVPNIPRIFFDQFEFNNNYSVVGSGPFHFKYQNKVSKRFSYGLNINRSAFQISYVDNVLDPVRGVVLPNQVKIRVRNTAFNLRGNIHFLSSKTHDLYFGIGIGYRHGTYKISSQSENYPLKITLPNFIKLGLEGTLGYRYKITNHFGLYSELGLAKSVLQFGGFYKF